MSDHKKPYDMIKRGEKKKTLSGILVFATLRLADIPLQQLLLRPTSAGLGTQILTSLGLRTIFTQSTLPLLTPLSTLSPTPLPSWTAPLTSLTPTGSLLVLMSAGSALKQLYWLVSLSQDSFPPAAAAFVSAFNTSVNSINALLFLAATTTSLRSQPQIALTPALTVPWSTLVGIALYAAGMAIEIVSEQQRAAFKRKPENEGKVCKIGLWRWARHVNYLGYALWRGGYAMVASGWVGGVVVAVGHGWDFSTRAIQVLDEYCAERYKAQWTQFKQEVPYRIIPGVY